MDLPYTCCIHSRGRRFKRVTRTYNPHSTGRLKLVASPFARAIADTVPDTETLSNTLPITI